MMQAALSRVVAREDLKSREAYRLMDGIAQGRANDAQLGCLLGALRVKGETPREIAAFARALQELSVPVKPGIPGVLVDTCGTGGDGQGTFNISTAAAIVAAAAGVTVMKHGNRGVSGPCGSADVLEALGVRTGLSPEETVGVARRTGFGFLYAPVYHPALARVAKVRKDLGVRTVFNIIGPLINPAGAGARLIGVYDPALVPVVAKTLDLLGVAEAIVVHGSGLDEITVTGPTTTAHLKHGRITKKTLYPGDFGIREAPVRAIRGGGPARNAAIIRSVLAGTPGPCHDIVVLNAAGAICLGGLARDLPSAFPLAEEAVRSGAAREKLADIVRETGGKA